MDKIEMIIHSLQIQSVCNYQNEIIYILDFYGV